MASTATGKSHIPTAPVSSSIFNAVPPEILTKIFASIEVVSDAASLARCSRYAMTVWTTYFNTLDLPLAYHNDPRWRSQHFRVLAMVEARKEPGNMLHPPLCVAVHGQSFNTSTDQGPRTRLSYLKPDMPLQGGWLRA